jgi:HK97 family phage major capsid protein
MDIIELRRLRAERVQAARALSNGEISDEVRTQFDALMAEVAQLDADIARAEQLQEAEARSVHQQASAAPAQHRRRTADTAEAIYCRFLRSGDVGAQRELNDAVAAEYRASNNTDMNITTAADGGDLVPATHYQGIIERARPMALYNRLGLRQIPGVGTTVYVPIDNEADSGAFVSTNESAAFDRDAPAVSKITMTLVKYTKKVDLTYELLQDEDARLLDFLSGYVAAGFAATMNALMVAEALADGTAGLTLDAAAAIGMAEVPELLYKLSAEYARGASVAWLMKRATEGYLRGLASSSVFSFGQPQGPATGNGTDVANTLWGLPQYSDDNMGALAASGKSLLIGNWNYMAMRLDPTMTLLRDPYTRSSYGEVILNYDFRADFEVLQAGAFQFATHPTA